MKNRIYKLGRNCFLTLLCGMTLGSCMSDTINLNPDQILEEDLSKDNLWGSYLTTMQRRVVPEDVNLFQRAEDLFGNMYSGYFAGTQSWEGGTNGTTYVVSDEWRNCPFQSAFVEFLSSWNILRQKVDSTSVLFAVGEVVKVTAMHKATDIYGPIPYTRFGLTNPVPYDTQEEVYKSFFKELDHAINVLTKFDQANPNSTSLVKFDLIFNSDLRKWIRYANSLKLRLAMRVSAVYPEAQQIAESAVKHPYGVIEDNDNNPAMQSNGALSFTYHNPIHSIWSPEGYEEDVMGATMDSYMNGFEDPRRSAYFSLADNGVYRGLRNGHSNGNVFKGDKGLSRPNIQQDTPYLWMTAAEVYFLRAEGALRNWNMGGTAKEFYEAGIRASFNQYGLKDVESYLSSEKKPAKYPGFKSSPSAPAASTVITVKWIDNGEEKQWEQIMTQKWLAMYPLGQEAWSEFRRTGYPRLYPIVDNKSTDISSALQIRRVPFPYSEYQGNKVEVEKAVQLLGGPDSGATRLWWDVQDKNIKK
ncbi:hypothetical protein, secreted [gut metagenome]|uniref:Lipoprotein n=1 Tax=gut metagenome TaxID=749906 RepID=J9H588_9ZZZZ